MGFSLVHFTLLQICLLALSVHLPKKSVRSHFGLLDFDLGVFLLYFVFPTAKETSPNPVEHLLTLNSCLQHTFFRIGANTDFFIAGQWQASIN